MQETVCVFGSSSNRVDSLYSEVATELGRLIAQNGWTLLCGGANSGLILSLAQSVQQNGGKVIAVVPRLMIGTKYIYEKADETIITEDLPARKSQLEAMSDAFIVLPGGIGTLDEVFTILATKQFQMHNKPVAFVNINGFLDSFTVLMRWLETENFIGSGELGKLCFLEDTAEAAVNRIKKQIEK